MINLHKKMKNMSRKPKSLCLRLCFFTFLYAPYPLFQCVVLHTLRGKLFISGAGASVVGIRVYCYSATRSEESGHLYIFWVHEVYEVFHDDVHTVFVEIAMIAETEEI